MATPDEFRRLALSFDGAEEHVHMNHPDFRVGGRIFATLGYPDGEHGMVALLPEQQELAIEAEPQAFRPSAGAWGRNGSTVVKLDAVGEWLGLALRMAWENKAAQKPKKRK